MIVDCDPSSATCIAGSRRWAKRTATPRSSRGPTAPITSPRRLNNLGCVLAIEKLCGVEAPERAQYWRVIMAELAGSPSTWSGSARTRSTSVHSRCRFIVSASASSILDIFETFCGARLTTNMMEIGGFSRPIPEGSGRTWSETSSRSSRSARRSTSDLLDANPIWIARTKGVGIISPEAAISLLADRGLLCAVRASTTTSAKRSRTASTTASTSRCRSGTHGDVYDRYLVRMEEMRQTIKIIRQASMRWSRWTRR